MIPATGYERVAAGDVRLALDGGMLKSKSVTLMPCPGRTRTCHGASTVPHPVSAAHTPDK